MLRCLNVSAHTRTQRAHSACAVLQEQGSSLILVKTSEAEQRKAELSVPLATPHQQSVHCLLYVRAQRFTPNKRSVSWTKTQYSAAHFALANAAGTQRPAGRRILRWSCFTSEEWTAHPYKAFPLTVGPSKPRDPITRHFVVPAVRVS